MSKNSKQKLQNHRGRFVSLTVNRVKTGKTSYNAKVRRVTDKTLIFYDMKGDRTVTVPLANVEKVA